MVQGNKVQKKKPQQENLSKRKEKHQAKRRKIAGTTEGRQEITETEKDFNRKVVKHQKKVYRSIEETIIKNAKRNREKFDLI